MKQRRVVVGTCRTAARSRVRSAGQVDRRCDRRPIRIFADDIQQRALRRIRRRDANRRSTRQRDAVDVVLSRRRAGYEQNVGVGRQIDAR